MLEALESGIRIGVAFVFAAASAHKTSAITRGTWRAHPVIQASGFGGRSVVWVAGAAATEVGVAVSLVLAPVPGLAGATIVLGIYAALLRRLDPNSPCHCFGSGSRTRAGTAVKRNYVLAVACLASAGIQFAGNSAATLSDGMGFAVVLLGALAGWEVLDRVPRPAVSEGGIG
jgi:hypothetical protein